MLSFIFSAFLVVNTFSIDSLTTGLSIYNNLLQVTSITAYFEILILVASALVFFSLDKNLPKDVILHYSYLVLLSILGSILLVGSTNFITLFLSIELQSFAVYVLSGLFKKSHTAVAASLKYFLIGALSSTLILLGSALVYGNTGLIHFNDLLLFNTLNYDSANTLYNYTALAYLVIAVGLLTKMAVAPFHY